VTFPDEYEYRYRYPDFGANIVCPHCGTPSGGTGCCWPSVLLGLLEITEPHICTPDCFTFAARAADPTIDDHFRAMGAHECEGCEGSER
jgi:hypothetical protein